MKILLLPLLLFACSDLPTKESQENEANPIEIKIDINNSLNDPADNGTQIDVDSESNSSSEATVDNTTGWIFYEFQMIN